MTDLTDLTDLYEIDEGDLKESIRKTFDKISEACRKKLKIFITDGEPSYKSIARDLGGKVIHLVQLHNYDQRGELIISKYEKLINMFIVEKFLMFIIFIAY